MRMVRWATYLWPGLPQLWFEGAWSGLALSIGFALLLDLLLAVSLVCGELLEPGVLRFGWLALGLAWISSLVLLGWGERVRTAQVQSPSQEDLFRRAIAEYLKGNWFETESLTTQVLSCNPRDVEARLLVASVMRRTKRYAEARRQLADLERIEASAAWRAEMEHERQLLSEREEQRQPSTSGPQEPAIPAPLTSLADAA